MYDYLIVGAGFYGAVFAAEAVKAGKKVLVIDKRPHAGGNCRTEDRDGITLHVYGPHIFHTSSKRVWDYVNKLAEFNNFVNSPLAVYNGEVYNLPFNMNTFSRLWGVREPKAAEEIIKAQIAKENITAPSNLEEQALMLVGRDVYEKLIKGYTEKQWGTDCKNLPPSVIKRLPVRFTYDNNYFNDRYQGIPTGGYSRIFDKLLKGAEVRLNTDYFSDRARFYSCAERIVFTGRIDEFYGFSLGRLAYRSLRFKTETLKTPNFQGNAVVNYTSAAVPYTRIVEHKHFEPWERQNSAADADKTVITYEYPQKYGEGAEPFYPVPDNENTALYERYRELSQKEDKVIFGGRLGQYRYSDMDKIIEQALIAGDRELRKNV
jgi:UDP-galactopyranose mutase